MKKLFLVLAILMMPLLGQAKIKALVVGCVDYRLASDDLPKFTLPVIFVVPLAGRGF